MQRIPLKTALMIDFVYFNFQDLIGNFFSQIMQLLKDQFFMVAIG